MKQPIQVENRTRETTLVSSGWVAGNPLARLRGLIGSKPLQPGQGLLIVGCRSVHTHFMGYAIDVLYLDHEQRVVGLDHNLTPWRLGGNYPGARHVLELPAGRLATSRTEAGDQLEIAGYVLP